MDDAGITARFFKHTLITLKVPELRETIVNRALDGEVGQSGLSVHVPRGGKTVGGLLVFGTFAKECVLAEYKVLYMRLKYFLDILNGDHRMDADQLQGYELVFIPDFYERGADNPFQGWDAIRIRTLLRDMMDAGVGICVYTGDVPLSSAEWYPYTLLKELEANNVNYEVK
jgi:hypothetical protein